MIAVLVGEKEEEEEKEKQKKQKKKKQEHEDLAETFLNARIVFFLQARATM